MNCSVNTAGAGAKQRSPHQPGKLPKLWSSIDSHFPDRHGMYCSAHILDLDFWPVLPAILRNFARLARCWQKSDHCLARN